MNVIEMGRLFYTESGRMLHHANEEITRWRWVRKQLRLPQAASEGTADLWMCLCGYPQNREPLHVRVNGRRVATLAPQPATAGAWQWRCVQLPSGGLRQKLNEIILTCESRSMNAWMLGVETGHRNPMSALSTDRGRRWQSDNMGASGVLRGEYLMRLRLDVAGASKPPPPVVYEESTHPRVRELRDLVPARIRNIRDRWKQVLALRTWVARGWTYEAFGRNYAPWDPATVFAWTRGNWGHGRSNPTAMCVHYGMVFAALAATLGHSSRGLAVTEDINGPNGHFMTEIWDRDLSKWIAHDPNFDVHYEDGAPLAGIELADAARGGAAFAPTMRRGGGFTSECPRLNGLLDNELAAGKSFAAVGVWRLNDVVSHPASAPPNHGSVVYCETDFIWYVPAGESMLGMFPHRTSNRDYFARPPRPLKRGGAA